MMKRILITSALACFSMLAFGQKFTLEKSNVSFYSHAPIEDIRAANAKTSAIFNSATSEIVFSVPIKDFEFAKNLMKEHFNEKYMESETFPKSTFQGKIEGFQAEVKGVQPVKAIGKFTVHGVTKDISVDGTIEMSGQKILMKAIFKVKLEDYNITRPQIMWQNIAEEIEVTVDFAFKSM